jgi:hypothetical protein
MLRRVDAEVPLRAESTVHEEAVQMRLQILHVQDVPLGASVHLGDGTILIRSPRRVQLPGCPQARSPTVRTAALYAARSRFNSCRAYGSDDMTDVWPPGDDSTDPEWEWVGPDGLTDAQRCACSCIRCGPVDAHDCDTRDCIPPA